MSCCQCRQKGCDNMAKKLPRGITFSEKENRYTGRFMVDGVRYTVHGTTVTETADKMDAMRYEVKHGIYCKPQDETIDSWFEIWMTQYKENTIKASTIQTYRQTFKGYISPKLGKRKICDVRSQMLQKLINDLYNAGYSKTRVNIVYVILIGMFRQAQKNQLILHNPVDAVVFPKFKKKQQRDIRVLTREEQKIFLNQAAGSKYYDFYVIALQTGMRINEILALEWSDIDFKNKVIHVNGTLVYVRGGKGRYKDSPKTESSRRDIPMLPDVEIILKSRRKQQMENKMMLGKLWKSEKGLENIAITYEEGGAFWDTGIRVDINKIINKITESGIDFQSITPHTFRHTFATRCVEEGMHLQVLKTILGHSSLAMTADLYSHVLPDVKRDEMKKIIKLF